MNRKVFTTVLTLAFSIFWVASAFSADTKNYRVDNNTGAAAADLHLTFTGTGGVTATVILRQPGNCPAAVIGATNPVVIDWNNACVANGQSVDIQVSTPNGPLAFDSGFWTDVNDNNIGAVGAGHIRVIGDNEYKVPSLTTYGLIALALLLAGMAVWMFRRRRVSVA